MRGWAGRARIRAGGVRGGGGGGPGGGGGGGGGARYRGGGGAEGQVLEVQDADLGWVDGDREGFAQGGDVAAEGGALQTLPGHRQQVEPGGEAASGTGRTQHERACGDERVVSGLEVEEELDAAARASGGQVQDGCGQRSRGRVGAHRTSPGISS
jgi:hypothetical protein